MASKDTLPDIQMIDLALIEPNPSHARQQLDETALKALAHSIRKLGLIHPIVVQPAETPGRFRVIVGERRRRAALLAGERSVPVLVRPCQPQEALEMQIFENLGLGMRVPLEPRDLASALQTMAERFENREAAAEHFGRTPTWLDQATAPANLSPKVSALLDSGKIASTRAAVQLEKLAQKNEAKADSLIGRIEQLPKGETLPKKVVDHALSEEVGRRRKKEETPSTEAPPATSSHGAVHEAGDVPPWEDPPAAASAPPSPPRRAWVNPNKMRRVAELLGLTSGDEDEVLARLVDEFLALKADGNPPF